jgi:hypothetical protein
MLPHFMLVLTLSRPGKDGQAVEPLGVEYLLSRKES